MLYLNDKCIIDLILRAGEKVMANIFDGINKFDNEKLIEATAVLESVNIKNISKVMAQRFGKQIIQTSKGVGKIFGRKESINTPTVKEINEVIEEKKVILRTLDEKEVMRRLIVALANKVGFNFKAASRDGLYENLSRKIIYEASLLYEAPKFLTSAQRADFIYRKYVENARAKIYGKEGETDNLNAGKKLERELLARLVYSSINYHGQAFTPRFENLPSYIKREKREEASKEHIQFIELFERCEVLLSNINLNKKKTDKLNEDIEKIKYEIENERKYVSKDNLRLSEVRLKKVQLEIEKDNKEKEILVINSQGKNKENEKLKIRHYKLKEEINKVLDNIKLLNDEILYRSNLTKKSERKIIEYSIKKNLLLVDIIKSNDENQEILNEYNEKKILLDKFILEKKQIFTLMWTIAYPNFKIDEKFLNTLIKLNPVSELPHIERVISEIHSYKDLTSLNNGSADKECILNCYLNEKKVQIKYSIIKNSTFRAKLKDIIK